LLFVDSFDSSAVGFTSCCFLLRFSDYYLSAILFSSNRMSTSKDHEAAEEIKKNQEESRRREKSLG